MTKRATGNPPESLAGASWLTSPEAKAVFAALTAEGHEARAVGGAVRNGLMNEQVKDIDIATTAKPDEVIRLAEKAGLKAVPTGLEHGTVTLISKHVPFEVTTLRRDIETFGRHARVTYTKDWAEDARRRDFTINSLYCDADGTILDPLDGLEDIKQCRVRFIGDAHDRIKEDYLRILRFFRFTAQYAKGDPDPAGLAACAELRAGLDQLSGERLRAELLRLLAAPRASDIITVMQKADILVHVLVEGSRPDILRRAIEIEKGAGISPDPVLRLGSLALVKPGSAGALRERLRLSSQEYERLAGMALPSPAFDPTRPEGLAKEYIYRHGPERFFDGALIAWAQSDNPTDHAARGHRLNLIHRFRAPELPVRGSDVLALGVPAGPAVGRVISEFEDWWIGADFPADPALLAAELKRRTLVTKP